MARLDATVCYTVGEPGAGKTYRRGSVYLADEFLPHTSGQVYTNYPLHIDKMAAYVAETHGGDADAIAARIHIIPQDVLRSWRMQESGPWDFFRDLDTHGALFALDEVHNFCPATGCKTQKKWEEWLGEVRHMGMQCEFLTQDPGKCHKLIERHTGIRRRIEKDEHRTDPFLKIPMRCWYELAASWTGKYQPWNWEIEQRRVLSRWVDRRTKRFRFDPKYFALYDSFSAPIAGGGQAAQGEVEREFQRRGKVGMLFWFARQSPFRLLLACLVIAFFGVVFSGQGGKLLDVVLIQPIMSVGQRNQVQPRPRPSVAAPAAAPASESAIDGATLEASPGTAQQAPAIPKHVQDELDQLRARARQLESQLADASAVVLLQRDAATFRDGYTVRVGEVVEYGDYVGARVDRIDWTQRTVVLDDGRLLRMGRGLHWSSPDPAAPPGDGRVSGDLSGVGPDAAR